MRIIILKQTDRELKDAPIDIKQDIYALFDELSAGRLLSMPISRPLPMIAKGLHELRLSGRNGEFRVFYVIRANEAIYIVHAAAKKKPALDRKTVNLLKSRIRSLGL